jgi:hypothetical protein
MSRKTTLGLILCVLGAAVLAGCGNARLVTRTQYGGVFALEGDRVKAMEQAHQYMSQHCGPGNYTILREGDVTVGQDQVARSDTYYGKEGDTQVAESSTRDATEWRVEYQCGGAPAQQPPPQPDPYQQPGGPPPAEEPPPPPGY